MSNITLRKLILIKKKLLSYIRNSFKSSYFYNVITIKCNIIDKVKISS